MRTALCVVPAVCVALILLWAMQAMIGVEGRLEDPRAVHIVDFVRLKRDTRVETKKRELPKKLQQAEAPVPSIDLGNSRPGDVSGETLAIMDSSLELEATPDLGAVQGSDTDITPLVRVEPIYPQQAVQRGISGWVEVMFTITPAGTVKNPRITSFHPSQVFNRAALAAVRKWRYAPKIENGQPVERNGVAVRLQFRIKDQTG